MNLFSFKKAFFLRKGAEKEHEFLSTGPSIRILSKVIKSSFCWGGLVFILPLWSGHPKSEKNEMLPDSLTAEFQNIIKDNFEALGQYQPRPYFMAFRCHDSTGYKLLVNKGAVLEKGAWNTRHGDIEIRVGRPEFDNNHFSSESYHLAYPYGVRNVELPLSFSPVAFRKIINSISDYGFRSAQEALKQMRAKQNMQQELKSWGEDFSKEALLPGSFGLKPDSIQLDSLKGFFDNVQKASRAFSQYPYIYSSYIRLEKRQVTKRFVSTESWAIKHERLSSLNIYAETQAEDGMRLWLDKNFYCRSCSLQDYQDSLNTWINQLALKLDSLRKAKVAEPYVGPVLLTSQAAAVFVHEVIGHRVEGHRQKNEEEGQTFLDKIGQRVLPANFHIYDDPREKIHKGIELNGHYQLDDEAVPAQKASIVDSGIFTGFLQSRSVVFPGGKSNGHGRANLGKNIVARMGVTRFKSDKNIQAAQMLDSLKSLLKKEGREFGYVVEDISGGYTLTDRRSPQSFKLEPLFIRKVYLDDRPSEVVRGLDVVGTPLVSLEQILLSGDDSNVFNGYCGAESGWVPVSAISPSLLFQKLEFEKKSGSQEKLPYMNPPSIKGGLK